jgi:hypothetical protein
VRGAIPALRSRWLRRLGWYPGDWVWVSLLTAAVAAAGAAVAIAFGGPSTSAAGTTAVAPAPKAAPAAANRPLPAAPEPASKTTSTAAATTTPSGRAAWPTGRNGWTIVLFSYPVSAGGDAPAATAARAAQAGLPEVGVLNSAQFSSLHPGYYVVFSGVYSTAGEAEAALRTVRASGFSSAYTRQISR